VHTVELNLENLNPKIPRARLSLSPPVSRAALSLTPCLIPPTHTLLSPRAGRAAAVPPPRPGHDSAAPPRPGRAAAALPLAKDLSRLLQAHPLGGVEQKTCYYAPRLAEQQATALSARERTGPSRDDDAGPKRTDKDYFVGKELVSYRVRQVSTQKV
jgi:hypothetical protein